MTVPIAAQTSILYTGDNTTQVFPFPFPLFSVPSDLKVYKKLAGESTWGLMVEGLDYNTTCTPSKPGYITFVVAPATGDTLQLVQQVQPTQPLDLNPHDLFPAESMETGLDRLAWALTSLNTRVSALETFGISPTVQADPLTFINNAVLCLKNHISASFSVPSGFNAVAIQPLIDGGVTIHVPGGSVFTTLPGGTGTGGGGGGGGGDTASLSSPNTFAARQDWGNPTSNYSASFDPAYGGFHITRNTNLPVNPAIGEHTTFASDLTVSSGVLSLVGFHSHSISKGAHGGNSWGIVTEAWNDTDKSGAGLSTQLFGAEFLVLNKIYNSSAWRHAGALLVFANRMFYETVPTNGVPGGGQAYNTATSALFIDTSAGRIGSSTDTGGNSAIECGWNIGIKFSNKALDSAAGVKAIGVDFRDLDSAAPEGGKMTSRVRSFIALPNDGDLTLATDLHAKIRYVSQYDTIEFFTGTTNRFMIGLSSGTLAMNDTGTPNYTRFIDLVGAPGLDCVFSFTSGNRTTAAPSNTATPTKWARVRIDLVPHYVPCYQ